MKCVPSAILADSFVSLISIYEIYYQENYLLGYSSSTFAWIGSIQTFMQFSATLLGGPLTDRWDPMVHPVVRSSDLLQSNLEDLGENLTDRPL